MIEGWIAPVFKTTAEKFTGKPQVSFILENLWNEADCAPCAQMTCGSSVTPSGRRCAHCADPRAEPGGRHWRRILARRLHTRVLHHRASASVLGLEAASLAVKSANDYIMQYARGVYQARVKGYQRRATAVPKKNHNASGGPHKSSSRRGVKNSRLC